MLRCGFVRGTWQVPLYFSCRTQEELCGPSRNWQLRKTCPYLKEGESLQAGHRLAEPSRLSLSSRSVWLQQQKVLPSCCDYGPLGVLSSSRRQIESSRHVQPFYKELRLLHPAPLLLHKIFCFWNVLFITMKAMLAGKMVAPSTFKWIPRFLLLHH